MKINKIEQIIIDWLKSGNENTTYLAHLICLSLDIDVYYLTCSSCGHEIKTTNKDIQLCT